MFVFITENYVYINLVNRELVLCLARWKIIKSVDSK